LLALLFANSALAQETTPEPTAEATSEVSAVRPLSYGTPVQGMITASAITQEWPLSVASADRVRVQVNRTDGNLIPDVNILDASGNPIASSYGSDQTYAAAEIDDFTLPSTGTYTVQVGRYYGETGETTGNYSLIVIPLGTAADNPNNVTIIGEAEYDTPVDAEITATHWQYLYTLDAPAADTVNVTVKRVDGTLEPIVNVLDANGTPMRTGYNDNGYAETGSFDLPSAGEYQIAVSRYSDQDGDTLGRFEMTVQLVGSGEGSPALAGAPGTIVYDQALTGAVTAGQWYQDWTLTTDAGDTITIDVVRTGGDLIPEVALLGGSKQEITHGYTDYTYAAAQIDTYDLAGPGTYTVRVLRQSGQSGETTGDYRLTVHLNGTGEGSPKLTEPEGEVTVGTPVEGEITNARWQNVWTFESEDGGSINVLVERTDGTLSPTIQIQDANGQQMTYAYSSNARDTAEVTRYSLPGPGKYMIVVGRDSDQSGYTEGSYTLTVSTAE
jgi:hypothetical protein